MAANISPTSRDLQILFFIYVLNTCSIEHIATRFFEGSYSACHRRLWILHEAGLISWKRIGSTTGVGSGKALVSLTTRGRAVLAEYLRVPASSIRPLKVISSAPSRDHHLAICDFCLALDMAFERIDNPSHNLCLEWQTDKELNSNPIKVTKSRRPSPKLPYFLPDKGFSISFSAANYQIFKLEMEMDPLRRPAIIKDKLAGYFEYIYSLKDCATSNVMRPFILWVVPDLKSQSAMAAWAFELAQQFGDDPSFVWITTRAAIRDQDILSPIWKVVGVDNLQSLLPESLLKLPQPQMVEALPYPTTSIQFDGLVTKPLFQQR